MGTTAIVAEILIAGLEALAWLTALALGIVDRGWFGRLGFREWLHPSGLKDWTALVTLVVVGAAYVLGIAVDRAADSGQSKLRKRFPGRAVDKPAGVGWMRLEIMRAGGELARFFEYQRSRMRVARATAFNCAVGAPAIGFFLAADVRTSWTVWTAATAALLAGAVLAQRAFRRIEFAYVTRLSEAYRILKNKRDPKRAAAVPYKRDGEGLKFLLVTTSNPKEPRRWTFPKGKFDSDKDDETLADTAVREAREEAGIEGKLDGKRLTVYCFPGGKDGRRVAAFLLKTKKDGLPRKGGDAHRTPEWFSPAEAKEKLSMGREEKFADQARRVVDAAVEALGEKDASSTSLESKP